MRTAWAIVLLIGLLASPVGCFASCPELHHECCPKASPTTLCPLDILSLAKAALPAILWVGMQPLAPVQLAFQPERAEAPPLASADLYLANRVLRI